MAEPPVSTPHRSHLWLGESRMSPASSKDSQTCCVAAAIGGLATSEALTDEQIEERARALLGQLTLDEKLGLMDGDLPFWPSLAAMAGEGYSRHLWVGGAVPRLGIPG